MQGVPNLHFTAFIQNCAECATSEFQELPLQLHNCLPTVSQQCVCGAIPAMQQNGTVPTCMCARVTVCCSRCCKSVFAADNSHFSFVSCSTVACVNITNRTSFRLPPGVDPVLLSQERAGFEFPISPESFVAGPD